MELLSGQRIDEVPAETFSQVRDTPPVPTTSVYSRTDGIASWRCCIDREGPLAENVEVTGSHCGLGWNPLVLFLLADRLAPTGRRLAARAQEHSMQQLSGLDASFLYLETDNAPMHIGGVSILDPATAAGRLDFAGFEHFIASRLHVTRTFRQRLVEVPLNLGKPYWIDDDDFDLAEHVERTELPRPGGLLELAALVSWEMAEPLNRKRPLWHILWVEGVDTIEGIAPGSVALISRVHHAAIDGMSGAAILGALFDLDPNPAEPAEGPPAVTTISERPPSKLRLIGRAYGNLLRSPLALRRAAGSATSGLVKSGGARLTNKVEPPPLPFSAPRTLLNVPIGKRRTWGGALLSLDRIRTLKTAVGATVNDVVLAICTGALRRYLLDRGALPEKPLVAMVPVSVRDESERGAMGNQVSAMLVSLPTNLADPLARLQGIHQATASCRSPLAGLAARLYSRSQLADRHRPLFNLVITNVPGPQAPLYVGGARLQVHIGMAPILDGMGLILPIFSYAGQLAIGVTSCPEVVPDPERLTDYLRDQISELESALAGAQKIPSDDP
nr:putative diacyglycerol O-acyltransferase MT1468 [Nerophis lumbriciformis]